ncbi:TSUP family transporter, partial [Rhizobiaceae sp. 2RAB30]
ILLPIMVLMDMVSLWTWRGNYHLPTLKAMLPGAMVGIGLGWLTAAMVTVSMIRLIVGIVAIVFVGRWIYQQFRHGSSQVAKPNRLAATFWGTISGFTSFVAHVGGPPFQMYALPLRLEQRIF